MASEAFKEVVSNLQAASNRLHARVQAALAPALPGVEGLRNPDTVYTPRILVTLHAKAKGALPARVHATLGEAVTLLDETRDREVRWLLWVENGRDVGYLGVPLAEGEGLEEAAELLHAREALEAVKRVEAALEGALGRR